MAAFIIGIIQNIVFNSEIRQILPQNYSVKYIWPKLLYVVITWL